MKTEEQKLLGVYHTHTKYSKFNHGKDSAVEMIKTAEELGLTEYAITDHGTSHFFGIRKKNVKKLRNIIDNSNKSTSVKTLMGMELNLLGVDGKTDYYDELDNCLDLRLMGAHRAGLGNLKDIFQLVLPNYFKKKSPKTIEKNTNAYISAIKRYKIDIITHPQEYFRVDLIKLAKACEENNCYLEINAKHLNMTEEEVRELVEKTNVKFIISSDAHSKEKIMWVERAIDFANRCEIPEERIANLNKLPNFEKKY